MDTMVWNAMRGEYTDLDTLYDDLSVLLAIMILAEEEEDDDD